MGFAASVVGVVYLIAMVPSVMLPSEEIWFAAGSALWLNLLQHAALMSFAGVPIAVGIAVLRYRLYDIELLITARWCTAPSRRCWLWSTSAG
jgi:hypothetical protein